MTPPVLNSLRVRLIIGAFIGIVIGVSAAGYFISALFRQHATALVDAEMIGHLEELASLIDVTPDGSPELYRALSDPRFSLVGSGYSWQISRGGVLLIKSTSISAQDAPIPTDDLSTDETQKIIMPNGAQSLIVYESLFMPQTANEPFRLQVNVDASVVGAILRTFNISLAFSLVLLAAALTVAAMLQVRFGLQPMVHLGKSLRAIRSGEASRLPGGLPAEMQPVADDLNTMIDTNAQMIARARTQAGNLAHALKAPLAILTDEAYALKDLGQNKSAHVILLQCNRMQRQIDYQIARARAAASRSVPGVSAHVLPVVTGIINAMNRLYATKRLEMTVAVDPACLVLCDPMDLSEMLGNLIDNACKWCKQSVVIRARTDGASTNVLIDIEDDGPGLPAGDRETVFQVGRRLDERVPGSGLGLPIVRDLAQLCGGSISLGDSDLGGLQARLVLPGSQ